MTAHPTLPSFRLDGRLVVVTGASQGIGRHLSLAFAESGAHVLVAARNADNLHSLVDEIAGRGGTATSCPTDITVSDDVAGLAEIARKTVRDKDLTLALVNNAGFGFTRAALEISESDWDQLYATQTKATFFACQKFAPIMLEAGYGKIINMSSTWSKSFDDGKAAYGSAKAAISHLTSSLSTEWAPGGIRVNALAPTATMTEFTANAMTENPARAQRLLSRIKLGRFAQPQDLVGAAIFLISEASDFISGQTLFVDGGWNV